MKTLISVLVFLLFLSAGCRSEEGNPMKAEIVGMYEPGRIISPVTGEMLERGALMEIKWTGFNIKYVRLELLKKTQYHRQDIMSVQENQGGYRWTIPYDTQPSVSYQIKLINAEDETDYIYSGVFQIR